MSDTRVDLFGPDGKTPAGSALVPADIDALGDGAPPIISVSGKLYRFLPQIVGFGPEPTPSYVETVPVACLPAGA
jgi:hypothetical protein